MFIQQVYKQKRWLAIAMMLFVAGQLFVGYKHGMVVSPFFNYGMYSHQMNVEKSYEIIELTVNNHRLRGQDFSPQQWDKILLPLNHFSNLPKSNGLYTNEVKRLLKKVHISTNQADFVQPCNAANFEKWYTAYLVKVLDYPVTQLQVSYRQYHFDGDRLQPGDSLKTLAQLCR